MLTTARSLAGDASTSPQAPAYGPADGGNPQLQVGAWSETVPLELPPGPGGLVPGIALTADFHVPDGPLGPGWRLDGLSRIDALNAGKELNGYEVRTTSGLLVEQVSRDVSTGDFDTPASVSDRLAGTTSLRQTPHTHPPALFTEHLAAQTPSARDTQRMPTPPSLPTHPSTITAN